MRRVLFLIKAYICSNKTYSMEQIIKITDKKVYASLVDFLKTLGVDIHGKKSVTKKVKARKYPLEGTLLKYDHPFDAAVNPDQWEATK